MEVLRDDGVVLYLNGEEILRDNMPDGPVTSETTAARPVSGQGESHFIRFVVPATGLTSGENVIAAEVHQSGATSSDLGFDLKVTALNHSVASYLGRLIQEESGVALSEEISELLPLPMREKWRSDFEKAIESAE